MEKAIIELRSKQWGEAEITPVNVAASHTCLAALEEGSDARPGMARLSLGGNNNNNAGSAPDPKIRELDNLFTGIEFEVAKVMKKRREANKAMFGGGKIPFDDFWEHYCAKPQNWAVLTFYGGTSNLIAATILWTWTQFNIQYLSFYGGMFGILPLGLALPLAYCIYAFIRHRNKEFETEELGAEMRDQALEVDKKLQESPGLSLVRNIAQMQGTMRSPTASASRSGGDGVTGLGSASWDSRDGFSSKV